MILSMQSGYEEWMDVKKLMILGGSRYVLPVIRIAHNLGLHVITCDYLPDNIAHRYSDEYVNVSIIDKDAVLHAAQENRIDGIMSFACDPGVVTAAYVAEKMGLPSCGPYESVCILQNKGRFRKFLAENGFNVPTAKSYTDISESVKDIGIFHWPVIVKPVDSAGSKGCSKVENPKKLEEAVRYALRFSRSGGFIIEDFIPQDGFSSDTDSFSVNGRLAFLSFNSQRFDPKAENPYTPSAFGWPSSMTREHQEELAGEIQRLLRLLGMGTSIYNIETREGIDGKAYIMECSPRGGGNRLAECLEYATGTKLIENAVRAALDMPIIGLEQKPYDGYWAEVILHSNKDGIYKELWIDEAIRNCVIERDVWVKPGDEVKSFTAASYSIGTLILRFENEENLWALMKETEKHIKVILED